MKKRFVFYGIFLICISSVASVILYANKWHTNNIEQRMNAATEKITSIASQLEDLNAKLEQQEQDLTEQEIKNEALRLTNISSFNTAITVYNLEAQKYNESLVQYTELEKTYNSAVDEQKTLFESIQKEFFLREYWQHIQSKILQ